MPVRVHASAGDSVNSGGGGGGGGGFELRDFQDIGGMRIFNRGVGKFSGSRGGGLCRKMKFSRGVQTPRTLNGCCKNSFLIWI